MKAKLTVLNDPPGFSCGEAYPGDGPWMTRREAAHHLRVSVDSIDRGLVPFTKKATPNKIRFLRMAFPGDQVSIRLLAADVYAILPEDPLGLDKGAEDPH